FCTLVRNEWFTKHVPEDRGDKFSCTQGSLNILCLLEQLILEMLSEGPWGEKRRLGLRQDLRQRLQDDLILRRLAENRPGDPHLLLIHKPSVQYTLELAIA
ncbi:hypothetical protein AKJ16_DCAP23741, partial [Drosera capensis]